MLSFLLIIGIILCIMTKKNNYVSHSCEPKVGDSVLNDNKKCKHYKSEGKVLEIISLDGDMGKVIKYRVSNDGNTYKKGDILIKTMDQLNAKN
tara:strand:+ start:572 stop:850 length:279 start_codon:yes stop_codon:yes gene_type:complete